MELAEKLTILADSAKYDVACTSSGVDRGAPQKGMGSAVSCGICHTFAGDGRCVSLLKVLLSNVCAFDCSYCVNRRSNDVPRATFSPRELADLTVGFYRRNYIEGLFLSSAVLVSPDHTVQLMIRALEILRYEYDFWGYIHAKAIPGADPALIQRLGQLADRLSVNIELPSSASLTRLAPDKNRQSILAPMGQITRGIAQNTRELTRYKHAGRFAPAGQSTQMIVGASPESDYQILRLTEGLYRKYALKRVFFSAYVPVVKSALLPSTETKPPLLREHRLYQADWLLRYYHFAADEILSEQTPDFNPWLDPKCNWAVHHMEQFPLEVTLADYEQLLRVPGIGPKSARRIVACRRSAPLSFADLKKMGVVLKRAQYFILCRGQSLVGLHPSADAAARALLDPAAFTLGVQQTSMFDDTPPQLTAQQAVSQLLR